MTAPTAQPADAAAEVAAELKVCSACHWSRPISDFRRSGRRGRRQLYQAKCFACERAIKNKTEPPTPNPDWKPPEPKPDLLRCRSCKAEKPRDAFDRTAAGTIRRYCRPCQARPKPKRPKRPRGAAKKRRGAEGRTQVGWIVGFGCAREGRLVRIGTRGDRPTLRTRAVDCPACRAAGSPSEHSISIQPREWWEGETVEAEAEL